MISSLLHPIDLETDSDPHKGETADSVHPPSVPTFGSKHDRSPLENVPAPVVPSPKMALIHAHFSY